MKRLLAPLVVAFLWGGQIPAQSLTGSTEPLTSGGFLESNPLGATIQWDGHALGRATPSYLSLLKPGRHTVVLTKKGYQSWSRTLDLEPGKIVVIPVNLDPSTVTLAFPENDQLWQSGQSIPTEGKEFSIPSGPWELKTVQGKVHIDPIFPDQGLLEATAWSIPVLSTLSILATLGDATVNRGQTFPFSPATVTSWGLTLADIAWAFSLKASKIRFLHASHAIPAPLPQARHVASTLFREGKDFLLAGKLEAAAANFTRLTHDYPDSQQTPGAWFFLARIHAIQGERTLALSEFRLVADVLQQSTYYDKACKAAADLEQASGDDIQALYHLQHMAFLDPLFSRPEIEHQILVLEDKMGVSR